MPTPRWLPIVRRWLTLLIVLVALMVAVGGVTRLTESGLSIVEWKLVSGTLPPMSETAWQEEFDAYKTSPQYLKVNHTFTLPDFQHIFWLEYLHRLLGRIIGLAVFLPLVYFIIRRALPKPLLWRMIAITVLVGAQGTVGWIMVASGLTDQPRVAPIKLALHLLLAFSLFGALLWTRWQAIGSARSATDCKIVIATRLLLVLALIQLAFGALVAGLRAGKTYNTYPLMDGKWVPDGLYRLAPWWDNHVVYIGTV
jgi:cytochrome c oxidase assembly protein subunit 15